MNKKIALFIGIFAALIVVGLVIYALLNGSPQKVTITFDGSGATLNLYAAKSSGSTDTTGSSIQTISSGVPFNVQKGSYVIKASGANIDANPTPLTVGDTPVTQTIAVTYTSDYLDQLLGQNQSALSDLILNKYPTIPSLYTLEEGKLFDKGEWYGTALVYKGSDTDNRDTLHLIAHLANGKWTLATTPQITLGSVEYPNIPADVLRGTDGYMSQPSDAPTTQTPTFFIDNNAKGAQ